MATRVLDDGEPASQIANIGDELNIVVGWAVPGVGAYFEFFNLDEAEATLSSVRLSLVFAALISTLLGVLLGIFAARRAVKPVGTAAQAASSIAGGRLDTRLESTDDPDLRILTESFNDMAEALQQRVERDARFASDVSHELRSPLMTLAASVEVMEARRDEMPERAQAALDLLSSDVTRFQGLVEDLLEISRFDAGAIRLHLEELLAAEFVRQAVAVSSLPSTPIDVSERAETALIRGDRRRLARVIANLIDNARAYGGGEPEITISVVDDPEDPVTHIQIAVEDRGPGVAEKERDLIFERFARGGGAGRRTGQRRCRARPRARRRTRADARWAGVGGGSTRRRERRPIRDRTDGDGAGRMTDAQPSPAPARVVATLVIAVGGLAGCAIQPDAAPRDIPEEDRGVVRRRATATGDETVERASSSCSPRTNPASRSCCARPCASLRLAELRRALAVGRPQPGPNSRRASRPPSRRS